MNKPATTQARTTPFPMVNASGNPPQPCEHALRPENPSLIPGQFERWTSCPTSRLDGLGHPSDPERPYGDRNPGYEAAVVPVLTRGPRRHKMISVPRKPPIQPDTLAPTAANPAEDATQPATSGGSVPANKPSELLMHPEQAPTASPPHANARRRQEASTRPNTQCNQETAEAMRRLMTMDLSAQQAVLPTQPIRAAARPCGSPDEQPIQPGTRGSRSRGDFACSSIPPRATCSGGGRHGSAFIAE